MTKYPHTRLFIQSPTAKMLEAIDHWFPVVSRPSVTDPYPLMEPVRHETYDQLRRRPEEVGGAAFALVISGPAFDGRRGVLGRTQKKPVNDHRRTGGEMMGIAHSSKAGLVLILMLSVIGGMQR